MARINCYRISVPNEVNSFVMPDLSRPGFTKKFLFRNIGALVSLKIAFPGDDIDTDYITLSPGESTDILGGLKGGEEITTDGISGSATAELIVWEE
jgi:hypothetical protein